MRVGLFSLLTVLFVGLKLTGYITWSWLFELAPLWAPFVAFFGTLALVGIFSFILLFLMEVFS